ncbi:MAG: Uma2 family endonuclease [Planctomycetota bacterium]|nr:MAG: Uma2 family endonuclease [Planctomycetota bacterium]REK26248.1 MAG: Uma2 family endonuclease [Planctomycetota bacterium]REK34380.1 MAG: Uma2 family endonuclease [Planctomycetota bacterium]
MNDEPHAFSIRRPMATASLIDETPGIPPFPVRRFSVREYRQLCESGLLSENDRVELLEGWIVPKMTHNPPHDVCVQLVHEAVSALLPEGWTIRVQSSISTHDSEPEPDLAVVKGPVRRYTDHHPTGDEIAMLVEAADTSLTRDEHKAGMYARAAVPVYWIVNLVENRIEVLSAPSPETSEYGSRTSYTADSAVPVEVGGAFLGEIPVADLLP